MASCGYVCPRCEGRGYLDDGTDCDFCASIKTERDAWIAQVHEGPCCADTSDSSVDVTVEKK